MRVAIIGTGISGSLAARLISTRHEVTLFEANAHAGGHAHTVEVTMEGQRFPVDTGFMVFNERTYPNFCRLLELLGIESQPSDMSFSVRCSRTGLEYQGSSLNGLFAQRVNCIRPSFLRMLCDIARFNRAGRQSAENLDSMKQMNVGEYLRKTGMGTHFLEQYLVPMAAAIWSSKPAAILDFPAEFMIGFFQNHGLMQIRDRPQWRTIIGGSRTYVHSLLAPIDDCLRLECPVTSVTREESGVLIDSPAGRQEHFDQVVFACHADQTLHLLADASPAEQQILSAFPYHANAAVLHTDTSLLPRRPRAWASWNYHIPQRAGQSASVTYDLSRLQRLGTPTPLLLTLNESESIGRSKVMQRFEYHHPAFACESLTAQQRHHEISGQRHTHYCGAYWGYGFHEDGVKSALAVAHYFGIDLEACTVASIKERSSIVATRL